MKRLFHLFPAILALTFVPQHSMAGDIRHTYAGDTTNSFYIDDHGGSVNNGGSDNSYYLSLHDINQSAFGTLLLYTDKGNGGVVDDGLVDEDFVTGSGIQLFDLSVLPGTSANGEIGLANDSPLTPVTFSGSQSGLKVEQVSYTSENPADQFVIVEYRVVNPTGATVQARLALSNDFDVDQKSSDTSTGFVNNGIPMVYQQEGLPIDPTFTTVGVGLIRGSLAQYRLENCSGPLGSCEIFGDDGDVIRKAFFEGVNGQVGDLTGGVSHQDFASTIAANLGSIPPGGARSVVFCFNAAKRRF